LRRIHILTTLLTIVALHGPGHQEDHKKHPKTPIEIADKRCSQTRVRACIKYAALKYGQSEAEMDRVAFCESRYDPDASNNGQDVGLFQYQWNTWYTLPSWISRHSPFSARYSALGAAYMWSLGEQNAWECYSM